MKSILITGGSGTFGQALTERLLAADPQPERLVIFSRGEHLQEQMARRFTADCIRFFIGDVRDQARLELAMRGIDTVIHTAALKIVPTCEYNPFEAIQTNVIGAENVIRAALRTGVRKCIALSTDKAVNPINLYGSTKLSAEKTFIAANNLSGHDGCQFSVARYGNVVGSRGSVVPFFKSLIANKKPLPITDTRMTRFWITLDQAVDFVLSSLRDMRGGEIFVPKIPSVAILDLAEALGGVDVECEEIGIRPGEKLHEVLLTEDESWSAVDRGDRYVILPRITTDNKPEGGQRVPEFFRYSSDNNSQWLSVANLKEMKL